MRRLALSRKLAVSVAWLGLAPWSSLAAQEGETPAGQEGKADEEAAEPGKKDQEKDAKYFAIVGGDVYSGLGSVLRGATVLSRNGKITEIGHDVLVPEGAETLDAHGLRVYPGMIALGATTRITAGLFAVEGPEEGGELEPEEELGFDATLLPIPIALPRPDLLAGGEEAETGDTPTQAEGDEGEEKKSEIEDTFDPFNPYLVLALATGITSVQQQSAAVKLKRNEIDGVLLRDRSLAGLIWSVQNPSGIRTLREKFTRASQYLREVRAWKDRGNKDEKEPSRKGVDTSALRVLSGDALAHFRASRREDLLGIARFAQEYGFRPVIEGCEEGWTVADDLGRAGAFAILTPRGRLPKDERYVRPGGASIENAAILHRSGVQIAVRPDNASIDTIGIAGRDLLHLPIEAGFAVRGGLSDEAALQAMTIVPARILGVDHRVGSLEVGKDCDAIVTDGDLLHYQTFVQYTVVDGKLVYDKEKEIYFAHIRPRPKKPAEEAATPEKPAEKQAEAEESKEGETKDEKSDEKKEEEQKDEKDGDGARSLRNA